MFAALLTRQALPWLVGAVACGVALGWGAWQKSQLGTVQKALEKSKTVHAQYVAASEAVARQATDAAREKEQQYRTGLDEAFATFEKEKLDAFRREEKLLADLRRGTVRVRPALCKPAPGGDLPRVPAPARLSDGTADDGAAIVSAAVGIGAECDRRIAGLQTLIKACVAQ